MCTFQKTVNPKHLNHNLITKLANYILTHQMNTSGERDRSREESGSEEDPLTKTSPPGDQNHHSY